jgi:bifunctional DNA-binding transcriptional regulator/antitoxin component of YhaV-PrlF toxin-antitoxin module
VTSKLQVTVPKVIADRYGIRPGDEIEWVPAGDAVRIVLASTPSARDCERQLELFDAATARQRVRDAAVRPSAASDRGWTREELYDERAR